MKTLFTNNLIEDAQQGNGLSRENALSILDPARIDLLSCLRAAYFFREKYFKHDVLVHILNNVQNGFCPEDCRYCAQSKDSNAGIDSYPMKPEAEILTEAEAAFKNGAHCYCMVFSGTGPSSSRINALTRIIRQIKMNYPMDVCVSAGIITPEQAIELKSAGLDRLNHNLNTSERNYKNICSTHTYEDRLQTLRSAKSAGLQVCSGVIIGLGETRADVVEVASRLREFQAESIPVNFYIPIPGAGIKSASGLTPEYCLRVLCLIRLMNPSSEIRMAAGREIHLRSMEAMGLYAANSIFLQGYLNARGADNARTLELITDAGFTIKSEIPIDQRMRNSCKDRNNSLLKTIEELRPFKQTEKIDIT